MTWAEDLPIGCPPDDSRYPNNELFYRFTATVPPSDRDFWSERKLYPRKDIGSECRARACSLIADLDKCKSHYAKLPTLKGKSIVKLVLPPESGKVKNTFKAHFSWWRVKDFDPVGASREVK